jgi:hypothetical protein
MVEKVNALCKAIDTLNSLPLGPNTDARLAELSEMLLAECKQMVGKSSDKGSALLQKIEQNTRPTSERVYTAGNDIEPGDPLLIVGDKVYSTRKSVQVEWQGPASPESNEGFHTLVPPTPVPLKEFYPDLGLPRLP